VVVKITDKETYVLTNNHIAGKGTEEPILFVKNEEQKIRATVVKYHLYVDMAVIKIPGKLKDKVAINKISIPSVQDPVYIVGNPLGNNYVYTEGVMAGYLTISTLFQAPCIYGNSGSGIFNAQGDLVGLVYALQQYPGWMGIPEAQITYSIAVDSLSIEFFLKDLGLYNE
jgi:serine protease Do